MEIRNSINNQQVTPNFGMASRIDKKAKPFIEPLLGERIKKAESFIEPLLGERIKNSLFNGRIKRYGKMGTNTIITA